MQRFEQEAYIKNDLETSGAANSQAAADIANAQPHEQTDHALAQRVDELSARNKQLNDILKLSQALKTNLELDQILDRVVRAVSDSLGFQTVVLNLVSDTPQPHLQHTAAVGVPPQAWSRTRGAEIPLDALPQLTRDEYRIGQSYFVDLETLGCHQADDQAPGASRPENSPSIGSAWRPSSALLTLLTDTGGKLQGLLSVQNPLDRHLPSRETVQVLEIFANQASLALENARLLHEGARRISNLSKLYQTSMALAYSTETQHVLEHIGEIARELTSSDTVVIVPYNSQADSFEPAITSGQRQAAYRGIPSQPGALTRRLIMERRPFVVADTAHEASLDPALHQAGIHALIGMPLISRGQVLGVMYAISRQPNKYTDDDVQIASALASQAALAIENGQLFKHLAESHERLQAVLDSTREGLMMLDPSGRIVFANAMFGQLFGTPPASLTGRRLMDVVAEHAIPPDEMLAAMMDAIYETLAELADQSKAVHTGDVAVTHPVRFFERVSAPVLNEAGMAIGRLLALRDITEARKAEILREDLMRMMVHDLRSPLASILGCLQVLEADLTDPYYLQAIRIASNSSNRLLDLINALLDISRMETGQMPLRRQELHWPRVVDEAVGRVSQLAAKEHIVIQTQLTAGLPVVYADESVLVRLLTNLLDNALKFSPPGATVTLSARLAENADRTADIVCQVSDTGPGIPPEYHERIFEKFFQVPANTGRRKGSGLGLTFCRLAIEAHGGRIWVESTPGQGSTFTFALPVERPQA